MSVESDERDDEDKNIMMVVYIFFAGKSFLSIYSLLYTRIYIFYRKMVLILKNSFSFAMKIFFSTFLLQNKTTKNKNAS